MSLAQAMGGIAGNLAVPPLAARLTTGWGFVLVAGVVLLGAAASLRLPSATVALPEPEGIPADVVPGTAGP
jgi:hypothetical protein